MTVREEIQRLWCQHCKALQRSNNTVVECLYSPLDDGHDKTFCAANEDAIDQILSLIVSDGQTVDRPKIICLCGSSRFVAEMAVIAWGFEKDGYITLGLHLLPEGYTDAKSHIAETEGVAERMDALHLKKIDLADKVFIVNKNGYIGESTAREIAYAEKLGKPVIYLEPQR